MDETRDEGTPSESRAGPRQPLRPLPSRASLADRLPPRPSELLKVMPVLVPYKCCLLDSVLSGRERTYCALSGLSNYRYTLGY